MRILYYNWVDYLDEEKRGGGVAVYQKNLISALGLRDDVEATFISSGISYDLFSNKPRWERVRHGPSRDRQHRYEIVNSGVISPAHHSFGNPAQVDQPETAEALFDFIEKTGPYDIVHFNNIEGLPASALALKSRFPGTRVVLTLHNYYPICPQVNLWFQERENCTDFDRGRKCQVCLTRRYDERIVQMADAVAFNLKKNGVRPGTRLFDRAFVPGMRIARRLLSAYARLSRKGRAVLSLPSAPTPLVAPQHRSNPERKGPLQLVVPPYPAFEHRRADFVAAVNLHCDLVLGVSDRVCDVAANFGIRPDLLHTSYIGTAQAAYYAETSPKPSIVRPDGTLTMAYLGYMRQDKGFYFLLEALETLPRDLADRMRLVICARRGDDATMARLTALSDRFAAVYFADGYTHDQLDALLEDVDLGVVPVLWEDNLPQVAIEMHARHIPLLTSDLGGAKELSHCVNMVFRAGNKEDFTRRLKAVLDGKVTSVEYWRNAVEPVSMDRHVDELLDMYRAAAAGTLVPKRVPEPLPSAGPPPSDRPKPGNGTRLKLQRRRPVAARPRR